MKSLVRSQIKQEAETAHRPMHCIPGCREMSAEFPSGSRSSENKVDSCSWNDKLISPSHSSLFDSTLCLKKILVD